MKILPEVAKRVSSQDKEDIEMTLKLIEGKDKAHDDKNMSVLFFFWSKYIPQHKQSIKCGGCRQAVLQFWQKVKKEWIK
jgi:hypothetical protein